MDMRQHCQEILEIPGLIVLKLKENFFTNPTKWTLHFAWGEIN